MSIDSAAVSPPPQKSSFSRKVLAFFAALIAILWGIFEYVFPDPIIYLYSIWRPEYVLIFVSMLMFSMAVSLFIWSYLKNKYLFFFTTLLAYIASCFAFFIIGKEYHSPEFTDGQPKVTAETGSIYYRGIEFAHKTCDREADTVMCRFVVANKRGQKEVRADDWRLVMRDGSVFKQFDTFRGGQKMEYGLRLDLPQGVKAEVEVVFYEVPFKYTEILKLGFEVGNDKFGFKNIEIKK